MTPFSRAVFKSAIATLLGKPGNPGKCWESVWREHYDAPALGESAGGIAPAVADVAADVETGPAIDRR